MKAVQIARLSFNLSLLNRKLVYIIGVNDGEICFVGCQL